MVFYVSQTGLTLSNTSGKARLQDNMGTTVSETAAYQKAPAGSSWSLIGDEWSWTTTVTPNAANVATALEAPVNSTESATAKQATVASDKTTKAKTGAVASAATTKVAKTAKAATTPAKTAYSAPASDNKALPLSPLLLASVGVLAVGYMLYEYRHDIANKYAQLRRNRRPGRTSRG